MKCKVVYITIVLLFTVISSGHSQKVSLNLLPSGSTEIHTYDIQTDDIETVKQRSKIAYSEKLIQITPDNSKYRRNSEAKKYSLWSIIEVFYKTKWSDGLIRLFSLPSVTGITL